MAHILRFSPIGTHTIITSPNVTPLFSLVAHCRTSPVPKTRYVPTSETEYPFSFSCQPTIELAVPQLSVPACFYALSRYSHSQTCVTDAEYAILLAWMHETFAGYLAGPQWSKAQAVKELKLDKAAGHPWDLLGLSKKGEAIEALCRVHGFDAAQLTDSECEIIFDDLSHQFATTSSVAKLTLKDELRDSQNPRGFLPMPVQTIAQGNFLYGAQNERFAQNVLDHPVTIGLQVPGAPTQRLFASLRKFSSHCADADGSAYDANFPLWIASLLCALRGAYLPDTMHALNKRYYEQVYCGFVDVCGGIYRVFGQRSGQTNTSADNSMAQACVFYLHAIRAGLTYQQTREQLLFYANGDDVVWSSKTDVFNPLAMIATARSIGMFWLCSDSAWESPSQVTYIGLRPCIREFRNTLLNLYRFKEEKLLSSAKWWKCPKRGVLPSKVDMIAKVTSLVLLSFGDRELYESNRQDAIQFVLRLIADDPQVRPAVCGLLHLLYDDMQPFRLFTGEELPSQSVQSSELAGLLFREEIDD